MIIGFEIQCPDCHVTLTKYHDLVSVHKMIAICNRCEQLYLLEAKSQGKTLYYFSLKRLGWPVGGNGEPHQTIAKEASLTEEKPSPR